jgi:hypothetical protein
MGVGHFSVIICPLGGSVLGYHNHAYLYFLERYAIVSLEKVSDIDLEMFNVFKVFCNSDLLKVLVSVPVVKVPKLPE